MAQTLDRIPGVGAPTQRSSGIEITNMMTRGSLRDLADFSRIFDKYARTYGAVRALDGLDSRWMLFNEMLPSSDKTGLHIDAGCGDGYVLAESRRKLPNFRRIGIDVSMRMLEGAKRGIDDLEGATHEQLTAKLIWASISQGNLRFGRNADEISANFVNMFMGQETQEGFWKNCGKWAAPGGRVRIQTLFSDTPNVTLRSISMKLGQEQMATNPKGVADFMNENNQEVYKELGPRMHIPSEGWVAEQLERNGFEKPIDEAPWHLAGLGKVGGILVATKGNGNRPFISIPGSLGSPLPLAK